MVNKNRNVIVIFLLFFTISCKKEKSNNVECIIKSMVISEIEYGALEFLEFAYDNNGLLTSISDSEGNLIFTYYTDGSLRSIRDSYTTWNFVHLTEKILINVNYLDYPRDNWRLELHLNSSKLPTRIDFFASNRDGGYYLSRYSVLEWNKLNLIKVVEYDLPHKMMLINEDTTERNRSHVFRNFIRGPMQRIVANSSSRKNSEHSILSFEEYGVYLLQYENIAFNPFRNNVLKYLFYDGFEIFVSNNLPSSFTYNEDGHSGGITITSSNNEFNYPTSVIISNARYGETEKWDFTYSCK